MSMSTLSGGTTINASVRLRSIERMKEIYIVDPLSPALVRVRYECDKFREALRPSVMMSRN
jgi:hypothetical protein